MIIADRKMHHEGTHNPLVEGSSPSRPTISTHYTILRPERSARSLFGLPMGYLGSALYSAVNSDWPSYVAASQA